LLKFFFLYAQNKKYKCGGEDGAEDETENGAVNKRHDAFVYEEKYNDDAHVCEQLFPCVRHIICFLSPHKADDHHAEITCEGCPCTCHVTVSWNEEKVYKERNTCTDERNGGAGRGFVGEFVPDAEIVINTKAHVGEHQYGHNTETSPIIFADEVSPDGYVQIDDEKNTTHSDDKKFHYTCISFLRASTFGLFEKEWLCAEPE